VRTRLFAIVIMTACGAAALPAAPSPAVQAPQPPPSQPAPQPPSGRGQTGAPGVTGATGATGPTGAPPPAVPASRKFSSDAGVIINLIKADKTADFEMVMGRVKEALTKSDNPKRKQMALSWRLLKGLEPGPGGAIVYFFWFDPPVKDEDYQITTILGEAFPNELQDLWAKFVQCFASPQTMLNLQQVLNMSPAATTTPK
jgi:hypothetical protein